MPLVFFKAASHANPSTESKNEHGLVEAFSNTFS